MYATKNYWAGVKDKVMEKLAAAAVPTETLDGARRMLESVVRDTAAAAQALSKDALQRIKTRLVEILPSLSPSLASKMVDDADKEAHKSGQSNKTEANCDHKQEDYLEEKINQEILTNNNPYSKL